MVADRTRLWGFFTVGLFRGRFKHLKQNALGAGVRDRSQP